MYDNKATARATIIAKLLCVVTALLAVLRVLHLLRWSWVWVTAPLWLPAAVLLLLWLGDLALGLYEGRK